ncbi:MAG: type IV pilus twitching motility protein PilT [Candidatus Omnitrophota bacterium]
MSLKELLVLCMQQDASDLHLTEKEPPILRKDGKLIRTSWPALGRDELKNMIYAVLTDEQKKLFERDLRLDIALALPGLDRFRVNIHLQKGAVEGAFRHLSSRIPSVAELGLLPVVSELARKHNGLVLVTGPTGQGKTTTLAAMINLINNDRECIIVCIEDPIEFVHTNKKSVIKQREVYSDTHSFADALRDSLRQDPNVIVVGEMRDLDTISTALTAAETGHLVLATLHTRNAPQTIERIIDVFPPQQQLQIKLQLADCLQGIISQLLLSSASGSGRVLVTEIMVCNHAMRNLIREHHLTQIPSAMQSGAEQGNITMDRHLKELYKKGQITLETAQAYAHDSHEFKQL